MQTRKIPISILNCVSFCLGAVASAVVLTPGLVYLMQHLGGLDFLPLAGVVLAISTASLLAGVAIRTLTLALMVCAARGPAALDWAAPSECATFATWLGCSWGFFGASGWQEGIRVCGLGVALQGTHGNEAPRG